MPTRKAKINRTIQKNFKTLYGSSKKVDISLRNLPVEINVDEDGKTISAPTVLSESYITNELVNPLLKTIAGIKANDAVPTPHYIIDFGLNRSASHPNEDVSNENASKSKDLTNTYVIEEPRFSLSRVILPESTKSGIEIVLSLIKHNKLMYETWNLNSIEGSARHSVTINMYGASGTGKTLCAEAIAHELGKKILSVKYSQLESSLVGETNKNIHNIFSLAKEKDCVLFFDEADSILGKRLSSVTQGADHGINMARSVMLIELEKFQGTVIFATNFVENYDSAFARRILHFIKFDMPDVVAREEIFNVHIPKELPISDEVNIRALAELTDYFSGGDIRNIILKSAAKAANKNLNDADKRLTKEDFIFSINEIKESKKALLRSSKPSLVEINDSPETKLNN